jgi:hypothetical protein
MKIFIILLALIIISRNVFAQTETPRPLTSDTLKNNAVLPQSNIQNHSKNLIRQNLL